MSPNTNLIENFIHDHEFELIHAWINKLTSDEKDMLRRMTGDEAKTLKELLNEILGLIDENVSKPTFADEAVHFSAPKYEVNTILAGEEAFVEILQKRLRVSPRTWNSLRRELSQTFHEALRTNSASTCDCCRWVLNQKFLQRGSNSNHIGLGRERMENLSVTFKELVNSEVLAGITLQEVRYGKVD
jgi:hypothetical protein